MYKVKKVVFEDAGQTKTAFGTVSFEDGFVKVTDSRGRTIYINKNAITFIKDLGD